MPDQIQETVQRKLKTAGLEPAPEVIKEDTVVAQMSGTHFHIIANWQADIIAKTILSARKDVEEGRVFVPTNSPMLLSLPAYWKLVETIGKLPDNATDEQRKWINEKIEELSRTITEEIVESVPISDKTTAHKGIKRESSDAFRIADNVAAFETTTADITKNHNQDFDSLELEKYRGKYIAIENGEIVGSGETSLEALREARKNNPNRKVSLKLLSDVDIGL